MRKQDVLAVLLSHLEAPLVCREARRLAYAICLCMFYEHKFNQSLYDCRYVTGCRTSAMIRAIRYIDDVLALVVWDTSEPSSNCLLYTSPSPRD